MSDLAEKFDKWKEKYESGERSLALWRDAVDLEYHMIKVFQHKEITPRLDYLQSKIRKPIGDFTPLIPIREFLHD